jgi:hypothetical protein
MGNERERGAGRAERQRRNERRGGVDVPRAPGSDALGRVDGAEAEGGGERLCTWGEIREEEGVVSGEPVGAVGRGHFWNTRLFLSISLFFCFFFLFERTTRLIMCILHFSRNEKFGYQTLRFVVLSFVTWTT